MTHIWRWSSRRPPWRCCPSLGLWPGRWGVCGCAPGWRSETARSSSRFRPARSESRNKARLEIIESSTAEILLYKCTWDENVRSTYGKLKQTKFNFKRTKFKLTELSLNEVGNAYTDFTIRINYSKICNLAPSRASLLEFQSRCYLECIKSSELQTAGFLDHPPVSLTPDTGVTDPGPLVSLTPHTMSTVSVSTERNRWQILPSQFGAMAWMIECR